MRTHTGRLFLIFAFIAVLLVSSNRVFGADDKVSSTVRETVVGRIDGGRDSGGSVVSVGHETIVGRNDTGRGAGGGAVLVGHETIIGRNANEEPPSSIVTDDEELVGRSSRYIPPVSIIKTIPEENIVESAGEKVVGRNSRIEQTVPVVIGDEVLIGRTSKYKPPSLDPSIVLFVFEDDDAYRKSFTRIVSVCKAVPQVRSAVLDQPNNTATLTVEPYEGSAEAVVDKIKRKLKDELKLSILESRVRH